MKTKNPRTADYTENEIAQRRDAAIKRALRIPPTHLKDVPKKRKAKSIASSKPDDA